MKCYMDLSDWVYAGVVEARAQYLKSGKKYMSLTRMMHMMIREALAVRKYAPETLGEIDNLRKRYELSLSESGDESMGELFEDKEDTAAAKPKFKPARREGVVSTYADVLDAIKHFDGVAHRREIAMKLVLPESVIYSRLKNMFSRHLIRKLNLGIYTIAEMGENFVVNLSPEQIKALERARKWAERQSPEDGI